MRPANAAGAPLCQGGKNILARRVVNWKAGKLLAPVPALPNNWPVPKWCKLIIGVLLLPVCFGAALALWQVVRASGKADTIWVATLSGAACWLVIYLLLPKPMWVYVFGHELTHVLWTWLLGGGVKQFKASAKGGHVIVTKNNFLIALAPYFFPLYTVMVVLVFLAGQYLWDWQPYAVWFHLLLGASYGFHVTLTWHILKNTQSDITEQGYLFSAVVIFLGNVILLLVAIPLLAKQVNALTALQWWGQNTWAVFLQLGRWAPHRHQ
jgi:hypothetical protein